MPGIGEDRKTMVAKHIVPMMMKSKRVPRGPPFMRQAAVPKKRPVPMTPPILEVRSAGVVERRTPVSKGYAPDHSDMTVLQLALEGGVNLGSLERPLLRGALVGVHDTKRDN